MSLWDDSDGGNDELTVLYSLLLLGHLRIRSPSTLMQLAVIIHKLSAMPRYPPYRSGRCDRKASYLHFRPLSRNVSRHFHCTPLMADDDDDDDLVFVNETKAPVTEDHAGG